MLDDFKPARKPVVSNPAHDRVRPTETAHDERPAHLVKPSGEFAVAEPPEETEIDSFGMPKTDSTTDEALDTDSTTPASRSTKKWMFWQSWHRPSKKQSIILAAMLVILIGGGTAFALTRPDKTVAPKVAAKVAPAPAPTAAPIISPLTGLVVTAEQQARPVTAVMIENSTDARPQSGLKEAGVVYEAIAEGGITRFMALFQEAAPGNVGPIRSARPYYLDWLLPFDASLAHVGGSPDALTAIKTLGVRDLDEFANSGAYHRTTQRYAPHNVYTSIDILRDLAVSKGYTKSTFTGFERKAENPYKADATQPGSGAGSKTKTPADTRTTAKAIDLAISGSYYNVHYDYDAASNSYLRSEGGAAHIDAESKTQLAPKVVVALVMSYSLMADGKHSQYADTGSGTVYVFQDGTVTQGTWTKPDTKTQFKFTDASGAALKLDPGQTWLTAVNAATDVTSTP